MAREDANQMFADTSFLYGANAAYIEELYAQYKENPQSVTAEWQQFFAGESDDMADVIKNAKGASWKRDNWPIPENGELVSAMDGDWGPVGDEPLDSKAIGKKIAGKGANLSDEDVRNCLLYTSPSPRDS